MAVQFLFVFKKTIFRIRLNAIQNFGQICEVIARQFMQNRRRLLSPSISSLSGSNISPTVVDFTNSRRQSGNGINFVESGKKTSV
jgi:hypothetical protein